MSGTVVTKIDPAAAVPRRVVETSSAGFATDERERSVIQAVISAQRKPASSRATAVTTILRTDFFSLMALTEPCQSCSLKLAS